MTTRRPGGPSPRSPYPAYKDSGVPWLGQVPEHWESIQLKWVLARNDGGVWGDDAENDQGDVVLRSTDMTLDGQWVRDEPGSP